VLGAKDVGRLGLSFDGAFVLVRRIRCRATAQESALCFTTIIAIAAAIIATFVAFVSATHAANVGTGARGGQGGALLLCEHCRFDGSESR